MSDLIDQIMRAADNNVLCYDQDADSGEFTLNLIAVMADNYRDIYKEDLLDIILPQEVIQEIPFYFGRIKLHFGDLSLAQEEFLSKNYTLMTGDKYLILGSGKSEVILGSF